ncbi:MAG: calcium-binding protein [Bacillota bacterium]
MNHPAQINRSQTPCLESLESRRLLSASVRGGTLLVTGTPGDDTITIDYNKQKSLYQVSINQSVQTFNAKAVKAISVDAGNGNDRVTVTPRVTVNTTILGGAGNDTLTGGSGTDLIEGGPGNDLIHGGNGNDLLYGDAGNDTLFGDAGNDTLGGDANEDLWFKGQTLPNFQTGDDSLNGGSGNDWLLGGFNSDTLRNQNPGRDTLTGGSGNDILDARGASIITDRRAGDIVPTEDHHGPVKPGQNYAVHIHAHLRVQIKVGGKYQDVNIPSGVGNFAAAPVFHTHDNIGTLHMHDMVKRQFTLGEFFRNWGVPLSATNIGPYIADAKHPLVMLVKHEGQRRFQRVSNFTDYAIRGSDNPDLGDNIIIRYG